MKSTNYTTGYNVGLHAREGTQTVESHGIEIAIDRSLCVGSGPCFVLCPRAFELDDSMKAVVLDAGAEPEAALLAAAEECPTQAIYLSRRGEPLYP